MLRQKKIKKMLLGISLSILSICLTACPSGSSKPDAFLCTFILKEPLEESYSFCKNAKTDEEKSVMVSDMAKWITSDPDSYDVFRTWYINQCKVK